jgi:hypothetical protein
MLEELSSHCLRNGHAARGPKLGARSAHWFDKICNFHLAKMSNGPTEALNNLIKRIKRVGFGFRNFENYRIRACSTPASRTGECSARSLSDEGSPRQNPMSPQPQYPRPRVYHSAG